MESISKIIILLTLSFNSFAFVMEMPVQYKNGQSPQARKLKNLISNNSFEGKFFKIVKGRKNDAIPFNHEDKELVLKAATAYYNFEIARVWFQQRFSNQFLDNHPQVIIRLEIPNNWNRDLHFEPIENEEVYNQAHTVRGTGDGEDDGVMIGELNELGEVIERWEPETWFHPKKVEEVDRSKDMGSQMLVQSVDVFRDRNHEVTFQALLAGIVSPGSIPENLERGLETPIRQSVYAEIMHKGMFLYNFIFRSNVDYYLDTVMIPEIIFHEYVHHVLSDYIQVDSVNPVVEGFANYYAARILGYHRLGEGADDYSVAREKHGDREIFYTLLMELEENAHADLTFSILWEIRKKLMMFGRTEKEVDQLFFKSREYLSRDSSIEGDMMNAIIDTCQDVDYCDEADEIFILATFSSKGL